MPATDAPAAESAAVGAVARSIAGYEIRGVLGEGGSGVVYDARSSEGRAVALKVMHPSLAGDAQIRGRFQREAAILRRLEGPHICPIIELGEVTEGDSRGSLYIALPKLEGPSLERVLRESAPLPVDRALDIMLEVCAALRSAHAHGVIHRDLKPANVILQDGDKVVVVDFGMSKILTGAGTGTTNLTAHNMVFGTPEYMSPEQARGDELDARCDVYAAGIMLYELLTGTPPFTAPTPLAVLTEHLTGEVPPPSSRAPVGRVTTSLESVVLHALARDRDRRYPSASALGAAILHARAAPSDVVSLRPEAFATSPAGADAFAATMPAVVAPSPPGAALDPTLPGPLPLSALSERPASARPSRGSRAPASDPSRRPPPRVTVASIGPPPEPTSRAWIALWILAGVVSVGVGIYFALRAP